MKPTKSMPLGSIVQVAPEEDHGYPLRLMVVEAVESWGVKGYFPGVDGTVSRTWNLVESTGGIIVFSRDGKRITAPAPPPKHYE